MAYRPHDTDPEADYGMLPGWAPIVRQLVSDMNDLLGRGNWQIFQVKEKFGTLRFYWHDTLDHREKDKAALIERAHDLVAAAEKKSAATCEVCGATSWGPDTSKSGWVYTLCPAHRRENYETGEPAWRMAKIA